MIHSILMKEDVRQKLISDFNKHIYYCSQHPEQIANLIITDHASESKVLVCAICVGDIQQVENQRQSSVTPLKYAVAQIHQSCNTLLTALPTCAFVDHHIHLIRMLAKNNCKSFQTVLQASISNFFQRTQDLLNGRYFQPFYDIISSLNDVGRNWKKIKSENEKNLLKELVNYISCFEQFCSQYEEYYKLSSEDKISGYSIILQIKRDMSQIYKEMKEKALVHNKSTLHQNNILELFNPAINHSRHYKFSSKLLHYSIKIVDPKRITIIDLTDNQYTLIALVEPTIGNKQKTIKFKMEGIKGWVALGIAVKATVQNNSFKFLSDQIQHGTFQASYDGYSWTDDPATNQQYNSWSYNQGDTLTLTVNPFTSELTYIRNDQSSAPLVLKYNSQKNEKLYFCVSMNYSQDSVAIID